MRKVTLNIHPIKELAPLTAMSSSLKCVSAAEDHTAEQYSKTGRTKPRNYLPRCNLSWNIYLPGLPQDTKPFRSCSGNRVKMLFKSHLRIKCHSKYIKVIRLLQHSFANSLWGNWRCIVRCQETSIVLFLLTLYFVPKGHTTHQS